MSISQNAKRAAQARRRRAKIKKNLEILGKQASFPGAASSIVIEYNAAFEKRSKLLKYDRDRAAMRRKQLQKKVANRSILALQKKKRLKEAKCFSYINQKKNGQAKALKAKQRAAAKFQFIKDGLKKRKGINNY